MNVIIVTACPSGMATSFLAARRLEQAARRRDWEPLIDMRSQFERELVLSDAQLAAAELVIVAASPMTSAGLERFVGKRVRVLDVRCLADFWDGHWLGVWSLGSARGSPLGTLVWSRSDRHVFVADWQWEGCYTALRQGSNAVGGLRARPYAWANSRLPHAKYETYQGPQPPPRNCR